MSSQTAPPTFYDYAADLARLTGRARTARRREVEGLFNVSSSTMSRWLQECGVITRIRGDKGMRRTVQESDLREVLAIQLSSYKQTQGPILPAEDAIEIAERNGKIPAGVVQPNTYNAWIRAQGISRAAVDAPTSHVNLISLGPNHVHQVDFSLAINWKIKDGTAVYDELVYKNKLPAAGQPRLLRMIVTDHCSGALFVWYTAAPGETTAALIEGLWHAWTEKRIGDRPITPIYPFRGVPRILMIDRGPGTRTQVFENFLSWLEVELNICEGSRSKGQVENAHWLWEQKFEGRFRLDPVVSVDRLNEDALQFAASLCKTKIHERTKATRTAHWEFYLNRNFESVLRVPNCSLEEAKRYAVSNDKSCRVYGDGTIQFKGNRYRLPESLLREKAVNVVYSPFDYPAVIVRALAPGSVPVAVQPLARNEHGFFVDGAVIGKEFKSHKYDQRQRLQAEAQQRIEEWTASSERIVTRGYHLEGLEASGIKSAETPIEANVQPVAMPAHQAREEVLFRVGRYLTAPERALLLGFGETVTEAEIAAVVEQIVNGVVARVIPMRAAAE